MSCDCTDPSVFSEHLVRRSRTEHQCCECRVIIPKGGRYVRVSGLWDGYWDTYDTCESCSELREYIARVIDCCVPMGGIDETLDYYIDNFCALVPADETEAALLGKCLGMIVADRLSVSDKMPDYYPPKSPLPEDGVDLSSRLMGGAA